MDPRDKKTLLADVFSEGSPAVLDSELLDQTLGQVRRKRRVRSLSKGALAALVLAIVSWASLRPIPISPPAGASPKNPGGIAILTTTPLPAASWIDTKRLPAAQIVSSAPTGIVQVSTLRGGYVSIGDWELLAFAPPGKAILFENRSGGKILIFPNPSEDRARRPN